MTGIDQIPFVDLISPHRELRAELVQVFNTALDNAGFIGGPMVATFEHDFAAFCGTSQCVGVSSGTDALRFALMAAGVGDGDVAVTVSNTFTATAEAISQTGARSVFVDIDAGTHNMDPRKLEEYIESHCRVDRDAGYLVDRRLGRRVAAIVPVHLYGQPADMNSILEIAERYNIPVIEDACQAHGAEYYSKDSGSWKKAGSMGRAGAFSFYPGKNLGACGEGGAVTTNDNKLAEKIRMLRDHGQAQKYHHDMAGYNGRLDAIQAGILKVKLGHLSNWGAQRRHCAKRYRELLKSTAGVVLPMEPPWAKAVYHLYVVRVENRERVQQYLADAGIGTGIHYPIPLHLQKAYRSLGYKRGDFPVCEAAALEILSLPMYPGLGHEQQRRVASELGAAVSLGRTSAMAMAVGAGSY
jgi:dTDP-4-amino-4,6-dideoxygalactose transaminase